MYLGSHPTLSEPYSAVQSNKQRGQSSFWRGENTVDGPRSCTLGDNLQLAFRRKPPETSSGTSETIHTSL